MIGAAIRGEGSMKKHATLGFVLMAALALTACAEVMKPPAQQSQIVVDKARATVVHILDDPKQSAVRNHVAQAKAVVVLPTVIKAGFFVGAEGGTGVLLVRHGGSWSAPAFYSLASGSFGFQAGIQDAEVIMAINSEKALDAVLKHQAKLGADAGITVGIAGAGWEGATTTAAGPDIVAFALSKIGAYAGLSLEGAALVRRKDLNEAYYGAGATPRGILLEGKFSNPNAQALIKALAGR